MFGQLNGTRYHDNGYTGKFGRVTGKPLGIFYYRTVASETLDFTHLVLTISYLIPRDYKGDREAIPHIHPIP